MNKTKTIEYTLLYIMTYMIIQVVIGLFYGIIVAIRYVVNFDAESMDINVLFNELIMNMLGELGNMTLISVIVTLVIFWFYHRSEHKHNNVLLTWHMFPMRFQHTVLLIIFGAATGIALSFILGIVSEFPFFKSAFENYDEHSNDLLSGNIPLLLLSVGIIVPIFEEILFRGIVLNILRRAFTLRTAVIIQALAFGIVHLNVVQSTYAAVLGFLLAYAALKFRTIIAPIAIHIGINSLAVLSGLESAERVLMNFDWLLLFIALIIFGLTLHWMVKYLRPIDDQPPAMAYADGTVIQVDEAYAQEGHEDFQQLEEFQQPLEHANENKATEDDRDEER